MTGPFQAACNLCLTALLLVSCHGARLFAVCLAAGDVLEVSLEAADQCSGRHRVHCGPEGASGLTVWSPFQLSV